MIEAFQAGSIYVASVSGGKDSAATALYLRELGLEVRHVFADTGWEADETYAYIAGPLTQALGRIDIVRSPVGGMVDWINKKRMFPSRLRRWCTEELKVKPIFDYIFRTIKETGRPVVNVVGLRGDESTARAKLESIDGYRDRRGEFAIWRPILRWTEADVIAMHHKHGLTPNPLYLRGSSRVGCYPCIFARKPEVRAVAYHSPERIDQIRKLEDNISHVRGRLRTFFSGSGPVELGGASAFMPIDRVVEWAKTDRGSRQTALFLDHGEDSGCVRWGMCEHIGSKAEPGGAE